jgi:hypothetical protein
MLMISAGRVAVRIGGTWLTVIGTPVMGYSQTLLVGKQGRIMIFKRKIRRLNAQLLSILLTAGPTIQFAYADGEDCESCGVPQISDLTAGGGNGNRAMDVGDIIVTNCEDKICVEYVLSDEALGEGWLITETHAQFGNAVKDIPQSKKGNPIPGKFADVQYFEGTDSYKYCIDLEPGSDSVVVAAHAFVTKAVPGEWGTVWQIGDTESSVDYGDGGPFYRSNYADEFNWAYPAGPTTKGPGLVADAPAFDNPFIVGSSLTADFPYNSNTLRGYATDFDVQWMGALPWGGRLLVSWSPGDSASEEKKVTVGGQKTTLTATGQPSLGGGWFFNTYPLVQSAHEVTVTPLVGAGPHTINFKHTKGDGTFWDYIVLQQPRVTSETAWGAGPGFEVKNWATYIEYAIQERCGLDEN